ncbi:hypothetical protein HAX54_015553 [Datura stramonium]|uniref:Uncharacterized protein n=1 Tax=Datura stramonium TaxID=4076 RepID=A0ABS8TPV0_DATST|nr:hypothetical protein [Datura stramonium]
MEKRGRGCERGGDQKVSYHGGRKYGEMVDEGDGEREGHVLSWKVLLPRRRKGREKREEVSTMEMEKREEDGERVEATGGVVFSHEQWPKYGEMVDAKEMERGRLFIMKALVRRCWLPSLLAREKERGGRQDGLKWRTGRGWGESGGDRWCFPKQVAEKYGEMVDEGDGESGGRLSTRAESPWYDQGHFKAN